MRRKEIDVSKQEQQKQLQLQEERQKMELQRHAQEMAEILEHILKANMPKPTFPKLEAIIGGDRILLDFLRFKKHMTASEWRIISGRNTFCPVIVVSLSNNLPSNCGLTD